MSTRFISLKKLQMMTVSCYYLFAILLFEWVYTQEDKSGGSPKWNRKSATMEDTPSVPKRKVSLLLVSFLGQSFTDTGDTVESKTANARAGEEMQKYSKAPSLPLTVDPLNLSTSSHFLSSLSCQSDTCVSQAQARLWSGFSILQEM